MKKIILVIFVIAIVLSLGLTVVACSNVNQMNMLSIGWLDYESYTYNVYKGSGDTKELLGELTYTFNRLKGSVTVNEKEFTESNGAYVEYNLNITAGEYAGTTMHSIVVFNSKFQPKASYKEYNCSKPEYSYTSFADYTTSSKKGTYTYTAGGKDPVTSEFKKTNAYDNESLHTLVRASVFDTASYSLSMSVPDNSNFTLKSVAVGITNYENTITTDYNNNAEIKCTTVVTRMSAQEGQGTQNYINYANAPITVDGKDVVKAMVAIYEGEYSYVLKNISVTKEVAQE